MRTVVDLAARRLSVAALAYYRHDISVMDDCDFDALSDFVAEYWNYLSQYYKDVFESADAIKATAHHIYVSEMAYNGMRAELRRRGIDYDLDARGFEATAQWEDDDGKTVGIMSLNA